MEENIKVRWLTDHEQTKIAPKTLITQVLNENGSRFKDSFDTTITGMIESIDEGKRQIRDHANNTEIHVTPEEKEAWNNIEVPSLDGYATEEYVENLYKKLNSNTVLGFYCIEDVTIVTNGISKTYSANSNVEVTFIEDDVFEIITTSDKSILSLTAFPGTLGTFYPWLEGVAQFSNILFDMNDEAMYSKWSQGNQGVYHVQSAQYTNCIFWSDNPYISDVSKRTNYTLTHTSQLPLCYSTIPDNTFKSFYLAGGVNSDPNWSNQAYKDSFAKANWATQVFSYYGARTVGLPGMFDIVLPKDCRGLMFDARNIENAGTFDAINTTNFGAKSGSWREAFGDCTSLRRLYIKNLKVSLNISWSPIDYNSISYIVSKAANTNAITISVSPYTYNLLSTSDFDLATSKNITIELLTGNYVEDRRLSSIADKADKNYVDNQIANLVNSAPETLDTLGELATAFNENKEVVDALNEGIINKQDKLSGSQGQIVGFDGDGNAIAQDNPQPDWNQNDESALDYIKNRTHYEEVVETVIVEEQIVKCVEVATNVYSSVVDVDMDKYGDEHVRLCNDALSGKPIELRIVFDGISYDRTYTGIMGYFGNLKFLNESSIGAGNYEDTGEPFAIGMDENTYNLLCGSGGEHTVTVTRLDGTIVHHLDPKYIKDMYYTEGEETVLIDGDFKSLSIMSNNLIQTGVNVNFIEGESYTLYINGENKGTVVCANSDFGVNFGSGYSSYSVSPTGNIEHFDGSGTFNIKFIQGTGEIVHQIDHKYIPNADWNASDEEAGHVKNRTHYTEVIENDIAGMEFSMPTSGGNIPHGHNIPFALGQVWGLKIDNGQPSEVEVRQAEDGTLHVGGMDIGPYDITSTNANFLSDWLHAANPKSIALIGVSGTYPTTEIHHLDHKYIKDMYYEEATKCSINRVLNATHQSGGNVFFDTELASIIFNHCDELSYKVTPDNFSIVSMNSEIISENNKRLEFSFGYYDDDVCLYVNQDTGEIYWIHRRPDYEIRSLEIFGEYTVTNVKKLDPKYLPEVATAQSNWNQNNEDASDFVKNRTHYEETAWASIFEDKVVDCQNNFNNAYIGEFETNEHTVDVVVENITNIRVIFDGVTYEVKNNPTIAPPTFFGNLILLNPSFTEYDTGEPFAIDVNSILITKAQGQHTISAFYPNGTIVHQLDPKYIKDMYYEEVGETTLVEATHTFNTNSDWANDFALKNCNVGDIVTVYWNDTPYTCVVGGNSLTDAYVGNSKLFAPNGIDTGEPFYIVNNSPSCYVCCTELGEVNLKITATHNDIHYLDSKYIKDMYYEKDSDVNIVGTEIRLNTTTDDGYAGVEILHNTNIPFELGQVWSCKSEFSSEIYEVTVQEADDGMLYIGDPNVTAIPFYVTNDIIKANSRWVDMQDAYTLFMTGISNRVIVNKIDQKYLPEVAIAQPDWNASEGETGYIKNKPLVSVGGDTLTWDGNTEGLASVMDAMYRVSGVTPEVEDFANGAYIYREAGADSAGFNIASEEFIEFAPGAIMIGELGFIIYNEAVGVDFGGFSFPESGIYLPCFEGMYISILTIYGYTGFDSEKIAPSHLYQPDWEQRDAGKPDYIKNKPIVCQPDYNQTDKTQPDFIKNRQFGDFSDGGDTLTWDGNTEERETTCFLDSYILVKVHSGALPAIDESHTITAKLKIGSDEVTEICTITADGDYSIIQFRDGYVIGLIIHEDIPFINCTPIPSKGVYFTYDFAHPESTSLLYQVASLTVDGYTGFPSIKKLDKKYLPMDDIFNEIMSRIPRAEEASF